MELHSLATPATALARRFAQLRCVWQELGLAAIAALMCQSSAHAGLDYLRLELREVVGSAEIVVAGRIDALDANTFELTVERWLCGEHPRARVRVQRFVNWACAARWADYAIGQRVLLFAAGQQDPIWALGAGNEGDMPLLANTVVLNDYPVDGYPTGSSAPAAWQAHGPLIPLEDLELAIRGFRERVAHQPASEGPPPQLEGWRPLVELAELERWAASSPLTRALWHETRHARDWLGPREPNASDLPAGVRSLDWSSIPTEIWPSAESRIPTQEPRPYFGAALAFDSATTVSSTELWIGAPQRLALGQPMGGLVGARLEVNGQLDGWRALSAPSTTLSPKRDYTGPGYGRALAALGDLDRDGQLDLLVGDGDRAGDTGTLWLCFGTGGAQAARHVELSAQPLFAQTLAGDRIGQESQRVLAEVRAAPRFVAESSPASEQALDAAARAAAEAARPLTGIGQALAVLGDLDGDASLEVALTATASASEPLHEERHVLIASLSPAGSVRWVRALPRGTPLPSPAGFGFALASIGDLDGDGRCELAVGEPGGQLGGAGGSVWIAFLGADGALLRTQLIGEGVGGFAGALIDGGGFAGALAAPGDVDGDGVPDLLATNDEGLWTLFLKRDGSVREHALIRTPTLPRTFYVETAVAALPASRAGERPLVAWSTPHPDGGYQRRIVRLFRLDARGRAMAD